MHNLTGLLVAGLLLLTVSSTATQVSATHPTQQQQQEHGFAARVSSGGGIFSSSTSPNVDSFVYLDNGIIKLGIDTSRGGAIGYLSVSGASTNSSYLNTHDFGRLVQGSFYSGPHPYDPNHKCENPSYPNWPWNPIGSGDIDSNAAQIVSINKTSETSIVVVTIPLQWACDDIPCECTFTQYISLNGNVVEAQLILENARTDVPANSFYSMTQELPAVYVIGQFCHLYTYNESTPFSGGEPHEVPSTWPWSSFLPSEHWMAFANGTDIDNDIAVGVWGPFFTQAGAGRFFNGNPSDLCSGGPVDPQVGYIAPWITEILDASITYSYNFSLVVGTVREVQTYALNKHTANQDEPLTPDYVFGGGTRDHTTFEGGLTDSGWPIPADGLILPLNTTSTGGCLVGIISSWNAEDAPSLYINASWMNVPQTVLTNLNFGVAFETWGAPGPCANCTVVVPVGAAGWQVVEVPLYASSSEYRGRMQRIRFQPSTIDVDAPAYLQIKSITTSKPAAV